MSQSFFRPAVLVLALAAACAGPAAAQSAPAASKPVATDAKGVLAHLVAYGEITAIDLGQRLVTIKGPKGNVGTYAVDPAAKNLDQVKVGDRIRLDYVVGVALALRKGGEDIREKVESESAAVAQPGAKPGVAAARKTTVVASVVSVNKKKQYATLKGPQGNTLDVAVQDPAILKDLKAGDQVVAVVTEAVALNVQAAPAKK
ncbi:hypothetical protein ACVNIS_18185 [Sphaerotilaceae bacterium SBD11-9]